MHGCHCTFFFAADTTRQTEVELRRTQSLPLRVVSATSSLTPALVYSSAVAFKRLMLHRTT
ncbi:hypothetical protein CLAFUW4_01445 [Fulvia fulva]|uniref:Uncharacterized protein n=1 Tax=Passalora fulva TaxID=5499 RepID=A0A9Q8L4I7_PASFU|nr:uncharacterized protein CLAFUR5_01447 [Fulvia fulva]KAK4635111.1 hypothetical protein CLAFUR4_01446 [Fulvia fulva]KAK4638597.1 hypothetical protein CLAFUR0_01447 [Fulvia fulva]UJO10762.1 hypothetical protein CLAFUR5_01447 [Fulvia fulva]WPV09390.1 hypothetical protein CLAFUW4_01445 [Fulvia fulva]WPV25229.1 hypothetical protein CLAFUW7_01450 [Fulvia fulva]